MTKPWPTGGRSSAANPAGLLAQRIFQSSKVGLLLPQICFMYWVMSSSREAAGSLAAAVGDFPTGLADGPPGPNGTIATAFFSPGTCAAGGLANGLTDDPPALVLPAVPNGTTVVP